MDKEFHLRLNSDHGKRTDVSSLSDRIGIVRAQVEAAGDGSQVLAVASALWTDGTSVVSASLARSLARAGYEVLLVRNGPAHPSDNAFGDPSARANALLHWAHPPLDGFATVDIPISTEGRAFSLELVRLTFAEYRRHFRFTVVDVSALLSGSGLSFARAADLILATLEEGRATREVDREVASILQASGTKFMGVVAVQRRTIRSVARDLVRVPLPRKIASSPLEQSPIRKPEVSSSSG